MKLIIDDKVRDVGVRVGVGVVLNVDNRSYPQELIQYFNEVVESIRKNYSLNALKDDPVIRAYRDFYWRVLGIDPTKQRPSQEALIRRVLRGEELPKINPIVDIGNIVSIKYMVPIGIYDIDKIGNVDLILRYAREGEEFYPIGSGKKVLKSNQIILATSDDRVVHVYPYRDSELTKVTENTRNILIISAGVPGVDVEKLTSSVHEIEDLSIKYLNGNVLKYSSIASTYVDLL